jgi:enoyl-CoA hydratase/carnithine racemase
VNTSPLSVGFSKRLLWDSFELDRTQVNHLETVLHHHLMGSADAREGVMAFLERREPQWTSRVSRDWPEWPEGDSP